MATFTELVRRRRKAGGTAAGSFSYGLRERVKEKFDPRRIFKQDGLLTALFPKLRAYKSSKLSPVSSISESPVSQIPETNTSLESIKLNSDIYAKNSIVLPSMARDVFLINKNIKELVKLFGGKPKDSWKEWQSRQQARETAYETKFKKSPQRIVVTKEKNGIKKEESDTGVMGSFFDVLKSISSKIFGAIGTVLATVSTAISGIMKAFGFFGGILMNVINSLGLGKIFKGTLAILGTMIGVNAADKISNFFNITNKTDITENQTLEQQTPSNGEYSGQVTGSKLIDEQLAPHAESLATASIVGSGIATATAGKIALGKTTARLAEKTSTAIMNAKTMSVGQMEKQQAKTLWGKFLNYVYKKSPTLFKKIGVKLAQAGALAAIPLFGWIGAAISIGFSLWTAWELFELWKEFNNLKEEDQNIKGTSPEQLTENTSSPLVATESASTVSAMDVKGATDDRQAKAILTSQNDKAIYESKDFKEWQDNQNASFFQKGIYNEKFGVDAYKKAMNITGTYKSSGDKVSNASNDVREQQREQMKPVVNVSKYTDTKPLGKPSTGVTNVDSASVFDSDFLELLGMDSSKLMFSN